MKNYFFKKINLNFYTNFTCEDCIYIYIYTKIDLFLFNIEEGRKILIFFYKNSNRLNRIRSANKLITYVKIMLDQIRDAVYHEYYVRINSGRGGSLFASCPNSS